MPDPGIAEVAGLAAVQENIAATPTTRQQRLARDVSRVTNEGHFREGLKKHAEARDVDFEGFAKTISGFGVEIDTTTGNRKLTAEEQTIATQITAEQESLRMFFDRGYDGLKPGAQGKLRDIILQQARRNPAMVAQVNALGGNETAFAERYLRDPSFTAHLKERLNEILKTGEFDNSVLDLFDEWERKKNEQQDIADEQKEKSDRLGVVKGKLKSYERDPGTGKAMDPTSSAGEIDRIQTDKGKLTTEVGVHQQEIASNEQRLTSLRNELAKAQQIDSLGLRSVADIDTARKTAEGKLTTAETTLSGITRGAPGYDAALLKVKQLERELEQLDRERREAVRAGTHRDTTTIEGEITGITGSGGTLETARNNLATKQGELQKLQDLQATEKQLEAERQTLEEQLREVTTRKRNVDTEVSKASRDYDTAKTLRLGLERTFRDNIQNALREAGTRTMNDFLLETTQKFDAALEQMKKEEAGEQERAMLENIQTRWQMPPVVRQRGPWWNRREETTRPLNKVQIDNDLNILLNHGDRQFIQQVFLDGRVNPATNAPYTAAEITSLLDNPDFMNKMRPEAVKQLLGRRLMTGGLRKEDIYIITTSDWGKQMIDQAITQNGSFRTDVQKVFGQDALNKTGFRERFSQVANEHPWWIYSLLGIPFVAASAMVMPVAREALNNQTP